MRLFWPARGCSQSGVLAFTSDVSHTTYHINRKDFQAKFLYIKQRGRATYNENYEFGNIYYYTAGGI